MVWFDIVLCAELGNSLQLIAHTFSMPFNSFATLLYSSTNFVIRIVILVEPQGRDTEVAELTKHTVEVLLIDGLDVVLHGLDLGGGGVHARAIRRRSSGAQPATMLTMLARNMENCVYPGMLGKNTVSEIPGIFLGRSTIMNTWDKPISAFQPGDPS